MRLHPFFHFVLMLIFGFLASASVLAESAESTDVRLVIDVSGSMKRNDPNNLRQPGVELLVELLPENSKAGVWTFGKWVNMLIPHREVAEEWRDTARDKASKINSVGLYTNIGEALEKAAYDIAYMDKDTQKNIILLTDGMVDIDKQPDVNRREWRRIVDQVIPKLKDAGYVIHTIALSKNADRDLMNKLSVSTGGIADTAESAEDLMKIFLRAFDAAVPAEQVALEGNRFVIDSSVEEFTALIFRNLSSDPTRLVSPDQLNFDAASNDNDLRWHSTERYDLITIKRPIEGEWIVQADMEAGSRITVVSNLNLRVRPLPNNVLKGAQFDVNAFLQEDGKTITDTDFLSLMDVEATLSGGKDFNDLQELWTEPLTRSGSQFTSPLPEFEKEGVYQLRVLVDGKTFQREYKQSLTLRQAFSADIRETFDEGQLRYALTVNAFIDDVNYSKTYVVASLSTPDKRRLTMPLAFSELDNWLTMITPEQEGEYRAHVKVEGEDNRGERFTYDLEPLVFQYSVDGGLQENVKAFVEEEPVKAPPVEDEVVDEKTAEKDVPAEPVETPKQEASSLPSWLIYVALGVGNLLLLGIGFFAYKKVMGGGDSDVIAELDDTKEAQESAPTEAAAESATSEEEPAADDFEEEPPMEDLEPATPDEPEEEAPEVLDSMFDEEPEPDPAPIQEEEIPTLEPEPIATDDTDIANDEIDIDAMMEDFGSDSGNVSTDNSLDGLDDLDAMALEDENGSDAGQETPAEDDDMVTAMLKAQGLDLAEDELDDAISSLIDDLEDDEEDDEKT